MKIYTIHDCFTGEVLAKLEVDHREADVIDELSSDSPDGFFKAHWAGGLLDGLGDRTVYAILH